MQHIIADPDILMREIEAYSNLPGELKDEIRMILSSTNPHLALRHSSQGRLLNGTIGIVEPQVHTYVCPHLCTSYTNEGTVDVQDQW